MTAQACDGPVGRPVNSVCRKKKAEEKASDICVSVPLRGLFCVCVCVCVCVQLESSVGRLNEEWKAVAKARAALEEAEARAYESERMISQIKDREKELRVDAAKAWIENWKAKTKLEGTLKIGKKDD